MKQYKTKYPSDSVSITIFIIALLHNPVWIKFKLWDGELDLVTAACPGFVAAKQIQIINPSWVSDVI